MVILAIYLACGIGTTAFMLIDGRTHTHKPDDYAMEIVSAIGVGLGWWLYWSLSAAVFFSRRRRRPTRIIGQKP